MTFELLIKLSAILFGFIIIGSILCLPLFKWNLRALLASSLFTKIIWWGPIFLILIAILYGGTLVAVLVTVVVLALSLNEFIKNKGQKSPIALTYFVLFAIWWAHLAGWFLLLPFPLSVQMLASVAVISVLSDVCAFFFGNYLSKHHLPGWLNNRKSWEGVLGQIVGAIIGGLFVIYILNISISPVLILLVGIVSAIGDLANSAAKRSLSIKDWGNTIPGHGGVLDRLSSLSLALAASFWFLFLGL